LISLQYYKNSPLSAKAAAGVRAIRACLMGDGICNREPCG
jgi:hypothetical protein